MRYALFWMVLMLSLACDSGGGGGSGGSNDDDDGGGQCVPQCGGRECGGDACGGSCGSCGSGDACRSGQCQQETCNDSCSGLECGFNGCGRSCGSCGSDESCVRGLCERESCQPSCSGRDCGSDGCGGSCGSCGNNETCSSGRCQSTGADTISWTLSYSDLCADGMGIGLLLYSPDCRYVWAPSSGDFWYLNSGDRNRTLTIQCEQGEKVCFGADNDDRSGYWGAGLECEYYCSDCCGSCGDFDWEVNFRCE